MTPNLNGVNAVLDRISAVQSRFSTEPRGGVVGGASSGTSFDSTLDLLSGGTGDGSSTDGLDPKMLRAQMFRALTTSPTGTADTSTPAIGGSDAVTAAKKYLGVPYVWGGTDPASGLDCSGLVQRAFADLGVTVPRTSGEQAQIGTAVASLDAARPGDLIAFGQPVNHIGIYAGNRQMVVAPHRGDVVKVQEIIATPVAIRRVLPETSSSTTAPAIASLLGVDGNMTVAQLLASVLRNAGANGTTTSAASTVAGTPSLASADASPYSELFQAAGAKYGIDPDVLAAVARAESSMDPTAVSAAGAQGLMQLMPATAAELGVDPMQPTQAIDGAARLLSRHLEHFGSLDLALAAYNAGGGAVSRYNGIPPYSETQAYVRTILADLAVRSSDASSATGTITRFASPAMLTGTGSGTTTITVTSPTTPTPTTPTPSATPTTTKPTTTTPAIVTPTTATTPTPTAPTTAPAVTSAVVTGPPITRPDPSSPISKPTATAWGPNTQTQVTSQGGTNGTTWEALGYLKPAAAAAVTGTVPKAKGPVALGVLRILQNATPAQLASKEFRQTLNDVNRDSLGHPTAPDVIEVDPAKDPAPVTDPNPNTGAPVAKAATTSPAPASSATASSATASSGIAAVAAPAAAQPTLARILPSTPAARVTT